MKIFSERLRELRQEKSLSMKALAKILNTSDVAINNWENGINEPKISYLKQIAIYFDVSCDYLLGLEDETGSKFINSFNNFSNSGNIEIK